MSVTQEFPMLDMSKTPIEILIDKFNAANKMALTATDFTIGDIAAVNGVHNGYPYNTSIVLKPTANSVWLSSLKVYIKRVFLNELMAVPSEVITSGGTTLYDVLDTVNAAYGIMLRQSDVEQAPIVYSDPDDVNSPGTVVVTARTTSPFYIGDFTITVNTQHRLGANLYENELRIFGVIAGEQPNADYVQIYDNVGRALTDTQWFKTGYSAVNIDQAIALDNGNIRFYGTFNKDGTILRSVEKNVRGEDVAITVGNSFGGNFANLRRFTDTATGKLYVIDQANAIGGRVSRLHQYGADGSYNAAFTPAITDVAIDLAITSDRLYVLTKNNNQYKIHAIDKDLYTPVGSWDIVVIDAPGALEARLAVDEEHVRFQYTGNLTSLSINGEAIAVTDDTTNVFQFSLEGARVTAWEPKLTAYVNLFKPNIKPMGIMAQGSSVAWWGVMSGALCLQDEAGKSEIFLPERMNDSLFWQNTPSVRAFSNGDIIAFGKAKFSTGEIKDACGLYSSTGRFVGVVFAVEPNATLKDVTIVIGEENV